MHIEKHTDNQEITYTDELLGDMQVVADFLPSPARNGSGVLGPLKQPSGSPPRAGKPMNANKTASPRKLGSDLKRVDAHVIAPHEYDELPEITDEMLARATVNKGGRPRLAETK